MAGLISTGIWGFICSMLPTGNRDEKGRMIMREHFMSGFTGWGWKIWKTVAGFFRLEIDELVVRRTMVVFELLIQKIRAINGAMAITQGNGKIKTVEPSEDGLYYLITLEEEHMSFVEYDFMRCQEFTGEQKFYHVEISSVSNGVIQVPVSEFEGSIPSPGDEVVQFGNSSRDEKYSGRHSAIYLHADESGQPAIDVLFDIYSKDWTGCVKTRVGGDIPGTNGLKGFYAENGMIKGVDSTGRTMYCIYPDGSAMFGDGSAQFNKDRSGHLAGGAIAWQWDEAKKKYVCTMSDVVLTWDNLSDEVKENLKGEPGEPGVDANLLPWVQQWDNDKTLIDGEYVISPKMFSGTKSIDGKLTGIAQGRDCITINGVKRTGIFAIVDDEVVFEIDPITRKYVFQGDVYAETGIFKGVVSIAGGKILLNEDGSGQLANGSIKWDKDGNPVIRGKIETAINGTRIVVEPESNSIRMYNTDNIRVGSIVFIEENIMGIVKSTEPKINLIRKYKDSNGVTQDYGEAEYTADSIFIKTFVGHPTNKYYCTKLTPLHGLEFWKEGEAMSKIYPPA